MDTKKETALNHYTGKNGLLRLNCAQAIFQAFNDNNQHAISDYAAFGGGNAPDGLCGAVYAAATISDNKPAVMEQLTKSLGWTTCQELKQNRVSCLKCIEHSAEVLLKKL